MDLSQDEIDRYASDGFLIVPDLLSRQHVAALMDEAMRMANTDAPERIVEKTGEPSSIYITDKYPELFSVIVSPTLLRPATQLLGGDVYLHQAKVNPKAALNGSFVAWHRDFEFWHKLDGMPLPDALTVAILLEDVDVHNAPLLFVPGSHRTKNGDNGAALSASLDDEDASNVGSWTNARQAGQSSVMGDLKYVVGASDIVEPFASFTGARGSAAFFDSNLVHGSTHNVSPRDRHVLFITYNNVENALRPVSNPRPPFIANRNFSPLRAQAN